MIRPAADFPRNRLFCNFNRHFGAAAFLFIAAIILPYDKPGPFAVRITKDWYAPVGGILMAGCGLYALTGFPLDDIWHRIFGQDVTLWGPTHL